MSRRKPVKIISCNPENFAGKLRSTISHLTYGGGTHGLDISTYQKETVCDVMDLPK